MACQTEAFTPVTIKLGNLPETPAGPIAYPIPVKIPSTAKSLLLYAFATTTNEASFQRGYFEIFTKEPNGVQYTMYMNFATGTPSAVTITSANVWLPITSERKVYVNLIFPKNVCIAHKEKTPGAKKLQGMAGDCVEEWSNLFITGWK